MKSVLASLLSGLALASLFPNWNLKSLAFLALLPVFYLLEAESGVRRFLLPLLSFLLFFLSILYWIPRVMVLYGGLSWIISVLLYFLLCAALALFYVPAILGFIFMRRAGVGLACLTFPFGWIACDLIRNFWMVNGFPWGSLGYTQIDLLWGQIADLGGIYAVTFLIVAVNSLAAWAFVGGARMRAAAAIVVLLVVSALYGARQKEVSYFPSNLIVGAVQPGIELEGSESYLREQYFHRIPVMVRELASRGARLVVLPEAPTVFNYYRDQDYAELINNLAAQLRVALIFNNTHSDPSGQYYNSIVFVRADGSSDQRYDKIHLVPFGEYVPGSRWLFFVRPLVREVSSFSAGSEALVAEQGGVRVGGFICYEAIFPELVRKFSGAGAELLVNITDDAWYGKTAAPLQHFQMARMRAIENRRFLIRCANTGISAVVDPAGRVKGQLGVFKTGVLLAGTRPLQQLTFYVRHGDLFARACAMIFGASLFILRIYGRRRIDRRTAAEV